jgi:NADH-quinone oxidoreductase subunit A
MSEAWLAALLFLALSIFVGASMVFISWILRVKARENPPTRTLTYECGESPTGSPGCVSTRATTSSRSFFVVFDVEVVFLFPWAVDVRGSGAGGHRRGLELRRSC